MSPKADGVAVAVRHCDPVAVGDRPAFPLDSGKAGPVQCLGNLQILHHLQRNVLPAALESWICDGCIVGATELYTY